MPTYLEIPKIAHHNRNLHSIVSPRSHHLDTLQKNNYWNYTSYEIPYRNNFQSTNQRYQKSHFQKIHSPQRENDIQNKIDTLTLPFHLYLNSKSYHLNHSRSLSSQSLNPQNKFYSFRTIREQKCRQKNSQGKVIKSVKVNPQKQRIFKKKKLQHLDQIQTTQSQNSPRESLNSVSEPKIQESQIIMRGADLYDDLMKQNGLKNSTLFSQGKSIKSIFQTPQVRKQLCQSTFFNNKNNINDLNCMTQPRKYVNPSENSPFLEQKTNYYSKYSASDIENNRFSFLKLKSNDRKF